MSDKRRERRILLQVFAVTLLAVLLVFFLAEKIVYDGQRSRVQTMVTTYARQIEQTGDYELRRLQIVTDMVRTDPQDLSWFARAAGEMQNQPDVLSLQIWRNDRLAAGQSVDHLVAPAQWQQLLNDGAGTAMQSGEAVFYGPIQLADGSLGILGIQGIYGYDAKSSVFTPWGISVLLLREDAFLRHVDFGALKQAGVSYQLSSLQTGKAASDTVLASEGTVGERPVTALIHLAGSSMVLAAAPQNGWLNVRGIVLEVLAALLAAVFMAGLVLRFFQLQRQRNILRMQATTDPLTNLSNRHVLFDELNARCTERNGHFLLCYLDLDGFKQVNDAYGHDIGDWLIQAASQRMLECLKAEDELFRLGGDEFVALLEEEDGNGWKLRVEALEQQLRHMFVYQMDAREICIEISVSVGCAIYPQTARTAAELLREADLRMFETKERYALNKR